MSAEGPGNALELESRRSTTPAAEAASDALIGTNPRNDGLKVHSASADKAEARPAFATFPTTPSPLLNPYTHASAVGSSEVSASDSTSELTSSSGGSLPTRKSAAAGRPSSSAQKQQSKNHRRPKSQNHQSRWSKNTVSSDDTGSDCRRPPSSSSRTSSYNADQSPHPNWNSQRQHSYSYRAPSKATGSSGPLMAANFGGPSGDTRRGVSSPRPKGRGTMFWLVVLPKSALTLAQ
jgi:PAB-dependent poly(A)-specific ribonuclease subunit 3